MLGPDFQRILCPYCNEVLDIVVDASVAEQEYIEDCQVCCRSMTLVVKVLPETVTVEAFAQDER